MMLRASRVFSLFMFWLESLLSITTQLIYELSLVPYIYIKQLINVFKLAGIKGLNLVVMWIVTGVFFLLFFAA